MELNLPPLHQNESANGPKAPPIYVVSGSMGSLGEQLAHTIIPQFPGANIPIEMVQRVQHLSQVEAVIAQAKQTNGTILHTIANPDIRQTLTAMAQEQNVVAIDIVGSLIERLTDVLGQEPVGKPGLYRELNETYFKRIEAIEFTLVHDDGMNYQDWHEAEIVLTGLSRVGKTPLSLYLSMLGWKVANIPLVPGVQPRPSLFELDRRRVIGLKIDPMTLLQHREHRQRGLGVRGKSDYNDPAKLYDESTEAKRVFRKGGFKVIDVTNKPIESTASQVIMAITKKLQTDKN